MSTSSNNSRSGNRGRGRGSSSGTRSNNSPVRSVFTVSLGSGSPNSISSSWLQNQQNEMDRRAGLTGLSTGSGNYASSVTWGSTATARDNSTTSRLITSGPQNTTEQNARAAQEALRLHGQGQASSTQGSGQSGSSTSSSGGSTAHCVLEPEIPLYQQLLSRLVRQKEKQQLRVQIEVPPKK